MKWRGKAKILLVDDSPEKALALESILSRLNEEIVTARSGADALWHVLRAEFAVILMDVNMPGMDGFEAAQRIRQREASQSTPIIFITSYDTSTVDLQRIYALGTVDFVESPIIPQVVAAKVETQVTLYRRTKELEQAQAELEDRVRERTAELEEANQQLRISEERFRRMADSAPVLIWVAAPDKRCIYFNKPWLEFVGRTLEQEVGYGWAENVHPADVTRCVQIYERSFEDRVQFQMEYRLRRYDGEYRWVTDIGTPIGSSTEQFSGFIGSCVDITLLKRTEADLEGLVQERTRQLKELIAEQEAFSYTISHDLRAPLRSLRGLADILKADCGERLDEQGNQYLDRIIGGAMRMDSLIQAVLAYSQVLPTQADLVAVNPERIIQEVIEQHPELRPPCAYIDVEPPLLPVLAHEVAFYQVASNLLGNAVKFVSAGVVPQVRVWSERRADRVRLSIQDNGIGVPQAVQHKVFGLFERLHPDQHYEGTGAGLAIVKRAVTRMQGQVGFDSEEGRGTCFWLELLAAQR